MRRREILSLLAGATAAGVRGENPLELRVARVTQRTVRLTLGSPGARADNNGTLLPTALSAGGNGACVPIDSGQPIDAIPPGPRITVDASTRIVTFDTPDPVLGIGEGGPQFHRRGHFDDMRNGQIGHDQRTFAARIPIPFVIGTGGWAIYFHQPLGKFDFTANKAGKFIPTEPPSARPLVFFVSVAHESAALLEEYAKLTGFPEMPPLWSFGYLQSHRTLASREEVMGVARSFCEKKLPCDALIYLGTGFCPSGWNTGHGSFQFNSAVFSDPAEAIRQLHQQHFHVVLHGFHCEVWQVGREGLSGTSFRCVKLSDDAE
jgi:alpha-glucosidase/alpha-D-xyloside xylohydrolase